MKSVKRASGGRLCLKISRFCSKEKSRLIEFWLLTCILVITCDPNDCTNRKTLPKSVHNFLNKAAECGQTDIKARDR